MGYVALLVFVEHYEIYAISFFLNDTKKHYVIIMIRDLLEQRNIWAILAI